MATADRIEPLNFKIVKYEGHGDQPWRYKLVGLNGETLAVSEGYDSPSNRDRAVTATGLDKYVEVETA